MVCSEYNNVLHLNFLIFRMSPASWLAMGGQICNDCSTCRQSEWSLSTYLGREKTNEVFKQREHIYAYFVISFYIVCRLGILANTGRCRRNGCRRFEHNSCSSWI